MSKQNAYIWRDNIDKDNFHVGEKGLGDHYYLWFTIFTDGIHDMFGGEMVAKLNKISNEYGPDAPIPIELTMRIKD